MGTTRRAGRALLVALTAGIGLFTSGASAAADEPLGVTVFPSTGLTGGQTVEVTVTGAGPAVEQALHLAQCDASVGDGGPGTPSVAELFDACGGDELVLPGTRPTQQPYRVQSTFTSFTGRVISCGDAPQDCLIVVVGPGGEPYATAPIDLVAGPLRLSATPTANLASGSPIAVTVTGARAAEVGVAQCAGSVAESRDVFGGPCGPATLLPAGAEPAELVLEADDVLDAADGTVVTCGDDCVLAAGTRDGSQFALTPIEFAGTDPRVHATPSTRLVDGQTVLVVATDVLPSVDGPPVWTFPSSGRWAVLQCGRAVVDDPSVAGVFTHCATPPGGGPVPGSASDFVVEVQVQATVTPDLGTTTDCTAAPGACVIALARVEPDATVSLLTAPLSFAT